MPSLDATTSRPSAGRKPRRRIASWLLLAPLLASLLISAAPALAQSDWAALQEGTIVLFRHANAPGIGDPANFKLDDCATQRNLDATGRAQARRIGEQFRQHGIKVTQVLHSQWCRTRETAQLAFPGIATDSAPFNSFFEDSARSEEQTAAALQLLQRWTGPGVLVVITHQVNITALTGVFPASGAGVIVKPGASGLTITGRVQP
jgi:phosphohistidine phosphatase SixA